MKKEAELKRNIIATTSQPVGGVRRRVLSPLGLGYPQNNKSLLSGQPAASTTLFYVESNAHDNNNSTGTQLINNSNFLHTRQTSNTTQNLAHFPFIYTTFQKP